MGCWDRCINRTAQPNNKGANSAPLESMLNGRIHRVLSKHAEVSVSLEN